MGYIDNWKERYENSEGNIVTGLPFLSIIGGGNKGERTNPNKLKNVNLKGILPAGRYRIQYTPDYRNFVIGQGIDQTVVHIDLVVGDERYFTGNLSFLTLAECGGNKTGRLDLNNVKIIIDPEHANLHVRNSLICSNLSISPKGLSNTSIIGLKQINKGFLYHSSLLFDNCTIELTEADITGRKDMRLGFNDCTFKIGNIERKLEGSTDEEYRESFVQLCKHAGIGELPIIDGVVMGNWGFANNSAVGGVIITDSILGDFQKRKGSIGYKIADVKPIPLFFDQTMPNSLEKSTADNFRTDLVETDVKGKIKLKNTFPLKTRETLQVSSKVINLHGEKRLTDINVLDNIITGYGMNISADHSLDETAVVIDPKTETVGNGTLEIGYKYVVRDTKKGIASFTYNGGNYNTSLNGSNIVPIVADPNDSTKPLALFTNIVGEPELYKVRSYELYQTMEMRIVDELPNVYVTSNKQLDKDFWYIVERTAEGEAYVTVDGKNYPVDCSFLVKGDIVGNVTAFKNARLRRCFTESYEYDSDNFYKGQQQPVWFKVVGNDMRCLRKNNSIYDVEMDTDTIDGKKTYVASGHPRFYNRLLESNGFRDRAFPIKGKYVQFRLHVSSFNIM